MNWNVNYLLLVALSVPAPVWSCSCGPAKPACAYLAADAIFLGRVAFTNDDGSGRFTQATLVRFDVEERFKGVAADASQIWIDPGSYTSCYEEYKLGERYLVFGGRGHLQNDSAAMTIMRYGDGKKKPLPPGFDPRKPPPVYFAPECAGSRRGDYPSIDRDLAMLRAFRAGAALPRVLGNVYLYPFRGWPVLNGPALKGARVTMFSGALTLSATTNTKGEFSLTSAPSGYYNTWADLPPYRMNRQAILHVPEVGCGYTDIQLTTTSTLQGIVLDHRGRPTVNIPLDVQLRDGKVEHATDRYALHTTTDTSGQFTISGVPDADAYLSAGSDYPTTTMPYRRVYYPNSRSLETAAVLRLKPGDHKQSMVVWLEEALEKTIAKVRVFDTQGRPGLHARVWAFDDRQVFSESAKTDIHGVAELPCLRGMSYELEAHTETPPRRRHSARKGVLKTSRVPFTCGGPNADFKLILEHPYLN